MCPNEQSSKLLKRLSEAIQEAEESHQLVIKKTDVLISIQTVVRGAVGVNPLLEQLSLDCPGFFKKALEYACSLYEGAPFAVENAGKSVFLDFKKSGIDVKKSNKFWTTLALLLFPAYYANGSEWPQIKDSQFTNYHQEVVELYQYDLAGLYFEFDETLERVVGKRLKKSVEAFIKAGRLSPIQIAGIFLLVVTFHRLVLCKFQS